MGFIYWWQENPSGILDLLFCFIVNNFVMFFVRSFAHALDVFVSHLFVFGFNLSFWVSIQMRVY